MAATLEEIKGWTFALSDKDLADCLSPDGENSAGMEFLTSVRDATVELIEDGTFDPESDHNDGDHIHPIADNAPDVYTHRRWQEFVDLGAYQEEPEIEEWPNDLTEAAAVALYQIAERLAYGILREWREGLAEASDGDEPDEEPTAP